MRRMISLVMALAMALSMATTAQAASVPAGKGYAKTYMSYRSITCKTSTQYKLQHSPSTFSGLDGFRKYIDSDGMVFYMIAVGTYYGRVGNKLTITMENGTAFNAIVGDQKANIHTNSTHQWCVKDGSVIEFIVDTSKLTPAIAASGNCAKATSINLTGAIHDISPYVAPNDEMDEFEDAGYSSGFSA